jgi:transcription antitermination factor NusG
MASWHVACLAPQSASLATANLKDRGYEVYNPIIPITIRHFRNGPNRSRAVMRQLFPGYLFVANSHNDWSRLENCPGVRPTRPLLRYGGGEQNAVVAEIIMQAIKAKEQELCGKHLALATSHGFRVGETVRIEEGAFVGFFAEIESIQELDNAARVGVLLSIFGRETRTTLPAECLASAS